jgi:hypothetical protein
MKLSSLGLSQDLKYSKAPSIFSAVVKESRVNHSPGSMAGTAFSPCRSRRVAYGENPVPATRRLVSALATAENIDSANALKAWDSHLSVIIF